MEDREEREATSGRNETGWLELDDREEERKITFLIPWLACGSWWLRKKGWGGPDSGGTHL